MSTTPDTGPGPSSGSGGLCALPLEGLADLLRRREVSPVEATRAALDRIAAHDGTLRTFIALTPDAALDAARDAEREIGGGRYRGPLHGVPLCAKDLFDVRGVPTTCGSPILRHRVAEQDAVAVARWREAGAVLLGKNTLHEFAFGGTSVNAHTGTPRNPWNPERIAGGSSGGSAAAVGAGFAFGSLGSETGNSVRRPAAFCGVVGLKPTFGRISRRGVFPLAWSLDHVGVFARTAAGAAALTAPLAGFDAADPGSRHPPAGEGDPATALAPHPRLIGRRAGVPRALLTGIDPEVMAAFESALGALRDAGVEVLDVDLPLASRWTAIASSATMHAEAAAVHLPWMRARPGDYGPDVLARLLAGAALTAADYARAQAIRAAISHELRHTLKGATSPPPPGLSGIPSTPNAPSTPGTLGTPTNPNGVDLLVAPGTPTPAPPLRSGAYVPGDAPWSTEPTPFHLQRLASLTGVPAASAPCGLNREGLPLAVQIAGRPWEEGLVLGAVAVISEAVPPDRRAPAIAPLTATPGTPA